MSQKDKDDLIWYVTHALLRKIKKLYTIGRISNKAAESLERMALSGDTDLMLIAAAEPDTPPGALDILAHYKKGFWEELGVARWIRGTVALNRSAMDDTIISLARDERPEVVRNVAARGHLFMSVPLEAQFTVAQLIPRRYDDAKVLLVSASNTNLQALNMLRSDKRFCEIATMRVRKIMNIR